MKTLYEKSCKKMYLEKYSKKTGNLLRTAEQFPENSCWVVSHYSGKDLSGEYTDEEFQEIKKYFN